MDAYEFETGLYESLYNFFSEYEFDLLSDKKQFRRPLENGFQNVILSHSSYDNEHWLEVNLGVRLNTIEHWAQQFLDNRKSYQPDANTAVISVGKLTDNKYFRYKVVEPEDLALAQEALCQFMAVQGFDFLNSISSIEAIDFLFNEDPEQPSKYVYNQVHRCFKGLIAAKLNMNPNFMYLMETYYKYLEKIAAKPDLICKFDRMASYLLHYSQN